ncbi:hypothetical protein [Sorangium sp. So ce1024]|uniref:hypothetical protein n=1 Tax=Sorangium sp. So ce1024 TaxID=3133327 RepID=UPI003F127B4B
MNDHDKRQLESMRHQIEVFREGAIELAWLISSLESLRHALQEVPQCWVDQLWSKWGVLEEIYSLSIVREQPLSPSDMREIGRVVEDIDAMVLSLLSTPSTSEG